MSAEHSGAALAWKRRRPHGACARGISRGRAGRGRRDRDRRRPGRLAERGGALAFRRQVTDLIVEAGEAAGLGGGGLHGYNAMEGTFLGGCIFTGKTVGEAV
jgi:hypothetical protein